MSRPPREKEVVGGNQGMKAGGSGGAATVATPPLAAPKGDLRVEIPGVSPVPFLLVIFISFAVTILFIYHPDSKRLLQHTWQPESFPLPVEDYLNQHRKYPPAAINKLLNWLGTPYALAIAAVLSALLLCY